MHAFPSLKVFWLPWKTQPVVVGQPFLILLLLPWLCQARDCLSGFLLVGPALRLEDPSRWGWPALSSVSGLQPLPRCSLPFLDGGGPRYSILRSSVNLGYLSALFICKCFCADWLPCSPCLPPCTLPSLAWRICCSSIHSQGPSSVILPGGISLAGTGM